MSFRLAGIEPTEAQYALLGKIVAEWALIENLLSMALARLALAPDFPAIALTEKLSYHHRLRAMKQLLDLHEGRYHNRYLDIGAIASGRTIAKKLEGWRHERNTIAHAIWMRSGNDALFAFEQEAVQYDSARDGKSAKFSNEDLQKQVDATVPLIESLEAFLTMLPEVPEWPPRPSP